MKTSNRFGITAVCVALLFMALPFMGPTGCTTTSTITNNPDGTSTTNTVKVLDVAKTCDVITRVGGPLMPLAVKQCPQCRQWFSDASLIITVAIDSGQYNPTNMLAAIESAGIKEIRGPDAEAAIQSVMGLYQLYYGDVVSQKLNQSTWLVPVLRTIRDLLRAGAAAPSAMQDGNHAPLYVWSDGSIRSAPQNH